MRQKRTAARNASPRETPGCIYACAGRAGTSAAATTRRTSTPPSISRRPGNRSSPRSSRGRAGAGATSTRSTCSLDKRGKRGSGNTRTSAVSEKEIDMFGLTPLGVIHTAISLIAVAAGLIALVRDKKISPRNVLGKVYVITTVLVCLTGFGIFQHGGFGKPHALGIITLVVLGVAYVAGYTKLYGRASPYIETVSYSATFLFHLIPGITETTTRLPLGAPLLPNAEAPALQAATAVMGVAFLIGAALQVRRLRAKLGRPAT